MQVGSRMEDWGVMGVEGHTRRKEGSCLCWGWALLVQGSWCTSLALRSPVGYWP